MKKYKSRNDVPEKYKWDLKDFFKNENDFNDAYKKCKNNIKKLNTYKGKIKDSILDFLKLDINTYALLEDLAVYAYLKNDEVLGISENIERKNKVDNLENKYVQSVSFFNPELLSLSKEEYSDLFNRFDLKEYKYLLDEIYKNKKHTLPEEKQNIISTLLNATDHFEDMSSLMLNSLHDYGSILIDGQEEKITPTNLRKLMKNEDYNIRKEVREKYSKVLMQYAPLSAGLLNGYVSANIENAKLHNFKDAWDQKLFYLELKNDAYDALINTCEENTKYLQKYYKFFKKVLNLKELSFNDINLEPFKCNKEYSIEDAMKICLEAVKPLGEDYYNHFKKVFDNHYIDFACYPGKCSGGYSASTSINDSRILLSYNYDLDSISTIIHEGGHNVHHQYVKENNPVCYRGVPNITAEVASLTNECLLSNYIAKNGKTKEERLAGINNIIEVIISNFYGAVREGKMELDFYDHVKSGNAITKDYMNDLTLASYKNYFGNVIKYDEYTPISWARRSHYYMNYYLFSYSFCISVASYVADKILSGDKKMLDNYLKFLKLGGNNKVQNVFKVLGVDLNKKDVYESAIKYFDNCINTAIKIQEEGELNG